MRLRLLVFLPLAGLITFLAFVSAASLVSALERSVVSEDRLAEPMRATRYETVCEALFREAHGLSNEATACGERHDWLDAATRGEDEPSRYFF